MSADWSLVVTLDDVTAPTNRRKFRRPPANWDNKSALLREPVHVRLLSINVFASAEKKCRADFRQIGQCEQGIIREM